MLFMSCLSIRCAVLTACKISQKEKHLFLALFLLYCEVQELNLREDHGQGTQTERLKKIEIITDKLYLELARDESN